MEGIRGVRLRKFNLRKIILGVRMHFRHIHTLCMSVRMLSAGWLRRVEKNLRRVRISRSPQGHFSGGSRGIRLPIRIRG